MLTLWSGLHIAGHVWRRIIVPTNLAQSFRLIYAHNHYCMINQYARMISSTLERQLRLACLVGLDAKKFGGTITLVHTIHDPKMAAATDSPLIFPCPVHILVATALAFDVSTSCCMHMLKPV